MTLKVALIQKSAAPNDPEKNMELGISYLEKAKELGADLALFPEMWSTGYAEPFFDALNYPDNRHYVYERQKWSELALTPSDSFVQAFCNTAKNFPSVWCLPDSFPAKKPPATLLCSLIEPEISCFDMTRYTPVTFPWKLCWKTEKIFLSASLTG